MHIGVTKAKPLKNHEILITFENNEQKVFDLKPYLDTGLFAELKNESLFETLHVVFDSLEWNNGIDICPEVLYRESRKLANEESLSCESGWSEHNQNNSFFRL